MTTSKSTRLILTINRPDLTAPGTQNLAFVIHPDVSSLPDRPGLFALLGRQPSDHRRPLYFGYADRTMRDQVPFGTGFAQAIRLGLIGFASAYVPGGQDPYDLINALALAYDAPINAAALALADIDAARETIHAQAKARRLAAQ